MLSYNEFLYTLREGGIIREHLRYYTFHGKLFFEVEYKDYESVYTLDEFYKMYCGNPHWFKIVDVCKSRRYHV